MYEISNFLNHRLLATAYFLFSLQLKCIMQKTQNLCLLQSQSKIFFVADPSVLVAATYTCDRVWLKFLSLIWNTLSIRRLVASRCLHK